MNISYDAWGKVLSVTGSLASTVGQINPIRYRGYYYDIETGFYLTGTRYYDPEIGRFINADNQISGVGGDIRGYNQFAYCFNNPVNMSDPTGNWPKWLEKTGKVVKDFFVTGAKLVATAVLPLMGFEFQAGVGCGLRGSVKIADLNIGGGGKVDLVTVKLSATNFDIGQEALADIEVSLNDIEGLGVKKETGYFYSAIYDTTTYYDESLKPSFDIIGFDVYTPIIGAHANISYNIETVIYFYDEIWN